MLRTLFKSDLSQLLLVEESAHAVPWNEETFKTCFEAGYVGWVIEQEKEKVIMGFIIVSMRMEECHILNLCVGRDYQHQGFGRQLLEHALNHAKQQGIGIVYLEVRRSNTRAISLYKKEHFHLIGSRKDYYPTLAGNEDALIFAKSLQRDSRSESC